MKQVFPRWFSFFWFISRLARGGEYYVSPSGDDTASGQHPTTAWRSVDRVNRHLRESNAPGGDQIRFRGGAHFAGNLVLDRSSRGTRDAPFVFGTYGRGPATLGAGRGSGITVRESAWVSITNLVIVAGANNAGDGIRFDRVLQTGGRLEGVRIEHCVTRGFGWHGIMIDTARQDHGFAQVTLADCDASGNRHAGIMIYGGNPAGREHRAHADVQILRCRAWSNPGDPDWLAHHSGSGIFVDGVDGGLVSECRAWRNGGECRSEQGGPVGIWAHASRAVSIQHCESFENQTRLRDGGGFDLDGGCENCVLHGNFSHDNAGPGFLVYTYSGAGYRDHGCQVTGNLSWHDGRVGSGYAGLQVGAESGCHITDLTVARNLVVAPAGAVAATKIQGHNIAADWRSNLILASPHAVLISVSGYEHQLRFTDNEYWRNDGQMVFLIDLAWPVGSIRDWLELANHDARFRGLANEAFGRPDLSTWLVRTELDQGRRWLRDHWKATVGAGVANQPDGRPKKSFNGSGFPKSATR